MIAAVAVPLLRGSPGGRCRARYLGQYGESGGVPAGQYLLHLLMPLGGLGDPTGFSSLLELVRFYALGRRRQRKRTKTSPARREGAGTGLEEANKAEMQRNLSCEIHAMVPTREKD